MERMKKYTTHISVSAIVIALCALGCALFQNSHKDWDSVMFAVAMMSGLVMVLVGWNIYSYFKIGDDIKRDVDVQFEENNKKIDERIEECKIAAHDVKNEAIALAFYTIGEDVYRRGDILMSIDYFARALVAIYQISDLKEYEAKKIFESIEDALRKIDLSKLKKENIGWGIEFTDVYIKEASKIDDKRTKSLINFLYAIRSILT